MAKERIISSDSHIALKDEAVFSHLQKKHQEQILEARAAFMARMGGKGGMPSQEHNWPAFGRDGEWDSQERLKDMDIDGVDAEVLYSAADAGAPVSAVGVCSEAVEASAWTAESQRIPISPRR